MGSDVLLPHSVPPHEDEDGVGDGLGTGEGMGAGEGVGTGTGDGLGAPPEVHSTLNSQSQYFASLFQTVPDGQLFSYGTPEAHW